MDLLGLLKSDVQGLPLGDHVDGLKAVLRHIEAAEAHLSRGISQPDDLAFTDAIYRCNQAFEGSLKEAYRVLAAQDPSRSTIHEIESYFSSNNIFRGRVVTQFSSYRREWRNPSTHDYMLDFDEDEALLAIMSVSTFAKLLVDQISEKLTFDAVAEELATSQVSVVEAGADIGVVDAVAQALLSFVERYAPSTETGGLYETEAQLLGSLAAYVVAALPSVSLTVDAPAGVQSRRRVDLIAEHDGEKVFVEVKRGASRAITQQGLEQLTRIQELSSAAGAILLVMGGPGEAYTVDTITSPVSQLRLVAPARLTGPADG